MRETVNGPVSVGGDGMGVSRGSRDSEWGSRLCFFLKE